MKKFISLVLAVLMVMSIAVLGVSAAGEVKESGKCGDNLTWTYHSIGGVYGTLTISGTGKMYDYTIEEGAPWKAYKKNISFVIVEEGVESVGKNAFYNYDIIVRVDVKAKKLRIGNSAFYGCTSIKSVHPIGSIDRYYSNTTSNSCLFSAVHYLTKKDEVKPICLLKTGTTAGLYCEKCDQYVSGGEKIPATHIDETHDGRCDRCTIQTCFHKCHGEGFLAFLWKIERFFTKLFRIKQYCDCGAAHY